MGFNLNVPLPGPFTYSRRLGRGGRAGHGVAWWVLIGSWWKPIVWLTVSLAWLVVVTWKLCALLLTTIRTRAR